MAQTCSDETPTMRRARIPLVAALLSHADSLGSDTHLQALRFVLGPASESLDTPARDSFSLSQSGLLILRIALQRIADAGETITEDQALEMSEV